MSTQTKWTPGPWKAQGHEIITTQREAWQFKVAILPTTIDPRPTPDAAARSIEERDANARLISLAPEMAELAQEVATFNETHYGPNIAMLVRKANAILAKLEGGTR